jgi:hypothetical protein
MLAMPKLKRSTRLTGDWSTPLTTSLTLYCFLSELNKAKQLQFNIFYADPDVSLLQLAPLEVDVYRNSVGFVCYGITGSQPAKVPCCPPASGWLQHDRASELGAGGAARQPGQGISLSGSTLHSATSVVGIPRLQAAQSSWARLRANSSSCEYSGLP